MDSICGKIIKVICPCLIRQKQIIPFENDEKHKFMSSQQSNLQDQIHHRKQHQMPLQDLNQSQSNQSNLYTFERQPEESSNTRVSFPDNNNIIQNKKVEKPQNQNILDLHSKDETQQKERNFNDVIKQDHAYYHLFKEKLKLLPHIFDIEKYAFETQPDTPFPLKIYCTQSPELKHNIFTYFYTLPTDFDTYQAIYNNFDLQKTFDSNLDQYEKLFETPENDAKVLYLSYKKVLIVQPRDFVYVRYKFKKDNQFWSICVSDLKSEVKQGKVRGETILVATRIIEKEGKIEVSVSSQVDMKMAIKAEMAKNRGITEIRKYLERVYAHIQHEVK